MATNPRRSFRPRKSAGGVEVDPGKCFDGFVFDHFGSSVGLYFFYINYTTIFMTPERGVATNPAGGEAIFPSEKVRRRGGGQYDFLENVLTDSSSTISAPPLGYIFSI